MIFLNNLSFIYVLIFIIGYNILASVIKNQWLKNIALLFGSILILKTIPGLDSVFTILGIALLVFVSGLVLSKMSRFRHVFMTVVVALLVVLFIINNYSIHGLSLLKRLGLSYILFRLIHFLVDSSNQRIKEYNLLSFLNYIIFFPTFIAGPIDRYNNFNYWVKQSHTGYRKQLFVAGSFKLCLGIVKKFFLVPIIMSYAVNYSLFEQDFAWQTGLAMSLVLYSFYILLDFSGYSDIAIGTAYLIGIKTPENFDNPYLSKNLSIFWKKWHMTFSDFLFRYVFKPLVTFLSVNLKSWPRLSVSAIGYLVTFIICGIWHGNTMSFIYWGLWHGVGLILFKLWQVYVYQPHIRLKGISKRLFSAFAVIFTFCFVTVGWFFFNYSTNQIELIGKYWLTSSEDNMKLTQGIAGENICIAIEIPEQGPNVKWVDFEYRNTQTDKPVQVFNNKAQSNGKYVLKLPNDSPLALYEIKARMKSEQEEEVPWVTQLIYMADLKIQLSDLQAIIFPARKSTTVFDANYGEIVGDSLSLPAEYNAQEIQAVSQFIDGYGWAIKVSYLATEAYKVDVQFKHNEYDWVDDTRERSGKYNFVHFHGTESFEGTNRNLLPGKYLIRVRYSVGELMKSKWFYTMVEIEDYVNGK